MTAISSETRINRRRGAVRRQGGFTLIELLIVMVILGLLASLVGPRLFGQVDASKIKTARAQIEMMGAALDTYRLDMGRYPTTEEGMDALVVAPINEPNWGGPYLKKAIPMDPWGHPYGYASPGTHNNDVDLFSYGKDGRPGGTGENADLTNW